jgi:hypothetical protein
MPGAKHALQSSVQLLLEERAQCIPLRKDAEGLRATTRQVHQRPWGAPPRPGARVILGFTQAQPPTPGPKGKCTVTVNCVWPKDAPDYSWSSIPEPKARHVSWPSIRPDAREAARQDEPIRVTPAEAKLPQRSRALNGNGALIPQLGSSVCHEYLPQLLQGLGSKSVSTLSLCIQVGRGRAPQKSSKAACCGWTM